MESKGFYFAFMQDDVWGIAFTIVYNRKEKDFQISLQLFDLVLAVGYSF